MKLNKKGWSKAERYLCPECWKDTNWERPIEPEFESDDFIEVQPKLKLSIEEAKNIYHDFASMYLIAKGTYPKDGMRKPFTLDILKMEIEKAEGK